MGGSAAMVHASCEVEVAAQAPCAQVKEEMLARVQGQHAKWHDPHNNGTYTVLSDADPNVLEFSRITGNKKYTDKMTFTLTTAGTGCQISGCSESQVFSIADFSTNYCNLRMLYCGSAAGCKSVVHDTVATEKSVKPSVGAGSDKD